MRNGNIAAFEEQIDFENVLILPMRNGNFVLAKHLSFF